MAQKPDGKPAKTEVVSFTRPAAERISRVVRQAEGGSRSSDALSFRSMIVEPKVFRVCTFTGSWTKTSAKTVTFRNQTATPNTAVAVNLFATITSFSGTRNCAIAREGTAWYLIAAEC